MIRVNKEDRQTRTMDLFTSEEAQQYGYDSVASLLNQVHRASSLYQLRVLWFGLYSLRLVVLLTTPTNPL